MITSRTSSKRPRSWTAFVRPDVLLFSAWPFLSFIADNMTEDLDYGVVAVVFVASVLLLGVTTGLCRHITDETIQRRAINAIRIGFVLLFTFGSLDITLRNRFAYSSTLISFGAWTAMWLAAVVGAWWGSRSPLASKSLLAAFVAMSILPLVQIVGHLGAVRWNPLHAEARIHAAKTAGREASPNVYYFILDAYGRADTMRSGLGFDNSSFLEWLETQGFAVLPESHSNFPLTHLSMATTFNMDYIMKDGAYDEAVKRRAQAVRFGENPVVQMFRSHGYAYVHGVSGVAACKDGPEYCIRKTFGLSETTFALLSMSPLGVGFRKFLLDPEYATPRTLFPEVVEQILKGPRQSGQPLFVYSHILFPHPPYLKEDCTSFTESAYPTNPQEEMRHYPVTVGCLNHSIQANLPKLLAADPTAIVIFQGDHGFSRSDFFDKPAEEWPPEEVKWRYGNLSAFRLPDRCRKNLYPTMSSVNTFRLIKACLWGGEAEFLPDRSFLVRESDDEVARPW